MEWIESLDVREGREPPPRGPADWLDDSLYLIDELERGDEIEWATELHWLTILAHELAGWTNDDTLWPDLTRETFDRFFEVRLIFEVHDVGPGWIRRSSF